MEGSGSRAGSVQINPDPGCPKTYKSYGSGSGSGTLLRRYCKKANLKFLVKVQFKNYKKSQKPISYF
jgi:hypothetical protein